MIEPTDGVPPALALLLNELTYCSSLKEMRRRVKGMLPELRQQSEVFALQHSSERSNEKTAAGFDIHLHGAMDLLANEGCPELPCRVATADRLARSVGLIGDRIWLTDLLSEKFIGFGRPTNQKLDEVIEDALVLSRLLPLIEAGVVKFRSPLLFSCKSCFSEFESRVSLTSSRLAQRFMNEFRLEANANGELIGHTGSLVEPALVCRVPHKEGQLSPSLADFADYWVQNQVHSAFWVAREAALTGGSVFSNSRIGLAGLLEEEGRFVSPSQLLLLDQEREITIPWVTDLNAGQILELRQEASTALPQFRERLLKFMSARDAEAQGANQLAGAIQDLREEAEQVKAELQIKQKSSTRFWKTTYGILGLGLSAYGVATDQLAAGVGGLLPILQLLIQHQSEHDAEVGLTMSKPGYVLVKARDILSHSH